MSADRREWITSASSKYKSFSHGSFYVCLRVLRPLVHSHTNEAETGVAQWRYDFRIHFVAVTMTLLYFRLVAIEPTQNAELTGGKEDSGALAQSHCGAHSAPLTTMFGHIDDHLVNVKVSGNSVRHQKGKQRTFCACVKSSLNSVELAPMMPHIFLANSITAHCIPRQIPWFFYFTQFNWRKKVAKAHRGKGSHFL